MSSIWLFGTLALIVAVLASLWLNRNRLTIRTKIVVMSLSIGLITLLTVVTLSVRSSTTSLLVQQEESLAGLLAMRQERVENYFATINKQMSMFTSKHMIGEATADFAKAFEQVPEQSLMVAGTTGDTRHSVSRYYSNEFRPRIEEAGHTWRGVEAYLPAHPAALILQAMYIADNPNPVGEKLNLERAPADIDYNKFHAHYHPYVRSYLEAFDYYDIFLFDLEGNLVYSVYKETDYATNILTGPYNDSNFSVVVRQALSSSSPDAIFVEDFKPYEPSYGAPASFIGSPVFLDGKKVGAAVFQMPLDEISEAVASTTGLGETGQIYMVGSDGALRTSTRFGDLTVLSPLTGTNTIIHEGEEIVYQMGQSLDGSPAILASGPVELDGLDWSIAGEIKLSEVTASARKLRNLLWLVGLGIGTLILGVSWFFARAITKPIHDLAVRFRDIAEGEADLTQRIEDSNNDELGELSKGFNAFVERIHDVIVRAANVSREVSSAATEIAATTEQMAQGLTQQRDQTTQVSAGVEEMSATVVEVARQSADATQSADQAGQQATDGGMVVQQTVESINSIADVVNKSGKAVEALGARAEQIGKVIEVINDIAEQTNLLALNAAIEAARAGEHGRGFAVVADEVRKLAERTTQATEEVAESIRAIQSETNDAVQRMHSGTERVQQGVKCAGEAGDALERIVSGSQQVAGLIQAIAAATEQQSQAADDISRNVESITAVTSQSAEGAEQMALAADELSSKSAEMGSLIVQFKINTSAV